MMKLTDTLYGKFTPRERLALFYEAMARKDYAEADRLADTCERKSYRMQDAAYLQNLQYIHLSCLYALLSISEAESRAVAALALLIHAQEKAIKQRRDNAIDAYIAAVGEILGTWEAWREFCATAGVDPESVMRTCWGNVPEWINNYPFSDVIEEIEADPEAKARALDLFMRHWRVIQAQHAA
jgi:predicted secreted protein